MDIETKGLGAGSYPSPPEDKGKWYVFKCYCTVDIKVYAEDEETARECCNLQDCDEYEIVSLDEIDDYRIED